jgi:hypothetical protein
MSFRPSLLLVRFVISSQAVSRALSAQFFGPTAIALAFRDFLYRALKSVIDRSYHSRSSWASLLGLGLGLSNEITSLGLTGVLVVAPPPLVLTARLTHEA